MDFHHTLPFDLFIPALVELYTPGRFPFDKLVKFYTRGQIDQAEGGSEKALPSSLSSFWRLVSSEA